MEWYCKPFDALTASELYAILSARSEVFVVEQRCVYLDPDGKDAQAHHLFAMDSVDGVDGAQGLPQLAAYLRLLPPGVSYEEASIGRVLTGTAYRGRGLGQELLNKGLLHADRFWPNAALRIGAQAYLQKLYESAGFATVGEPYDEDGIPHIEMVRRIHH
ncbi:GNAT family N-acetyltransferase [Variovorax sp. KBW07]|uniref:GNAT family N-acetyltransferase n=1 Tax=Variovorax sp. KBW07 TaxID=2153358 RepID=UPI000F58AA5E|nr:GNAT family N-acetyltransferase [Variovorax sp. KBW07]RQO46548.1 GNAT family N-acetyltransferase [Variovorax sp. KBW07]